MRVFNSLVYVSEYVYVPVDTQTVLESRNPSSSALILTEILFCDALKFAVGL